MESVKHVAEVAAEKVKEGYNYVASAISGSETQAKEMDPASRQILEAKIEKFNDEREEARQRLDECDDKCDDKSSLGKTSLKSEKLSSFKYKEGQQF